MTVTAMYESSSQRSWAPGINSLVCLEDKYEVIKEVGDGSFGSVALARVRSSNTVARRNTMVSTLLVNLTCVYRSLTSQIGRRQDDEENL